MKVHIIKSYNDKEVITIRGLQAFYDIVARYNKGTGVVVSQTRKTIIDRPYNSETGERAKWHDEVVPNELDVLVDFYLE